MSTIVFKFLQMTHFLKPLYIRFSNFRCSVTRLQGFRMIKFSLVKNPRWPSILKIAKPMKSFFSPEPLYTFSWNLIWSINGTLVFMNIKIKIIKKIYSGIKSVTDWKFTSTLNEFTWSLTFKSFSPEWLGIFGKNFVCSMWDLGSYVTLSI